ncbi:MAG: aldehyde-activating protein, partial [Gammaproteobacteria bacterium]|nr:aldehyde-activating protein [Gammaproteobacteria bacterium]
MYKGQCLCGAVAFEVEEIIGPFELCHCTRCRKSTGSAFA